MHSYVKQYQTVLLEILDIEGLEFDEIELSENR
jgi:hypothetical protein